jgi:hypothetical protein
MKKLSFLIAFLGLTIGVYAQCTPNPNVTKPGLSPSKLPDAIVGQAYSEVATLMVPKDTSITYQGNLYNVVVDSATVVSISDLPPGFAYECDNIHKTWNGGAKGCARLFGNPLAANVGKFEVMVRVRTYFKIVGLPNQLDQYDSSTIDINIVLPNAIEEQFQQVGMKAYPNPVSNLLKVSINQFNTEGSMEIVDLMGKSMDIKPSYSSQTGEASFDVSNLVPGVYIVKREAASMIYQTKFIKE